MKGDKVVRWELLTGNRSFTPRGSLIIEFTESDPAMIFKTPRRHSGQLQVQNVRKGTSEVMEVRIEGCSPGAAIVLPTARCGGSTRRTTKRRARCCSRSSPIS